MSPTWKDFETSLSRILSHAKLCRGLIHLALFPVPANNIIAVVSDVQKQKNWNWNDISNPPTLAGLFWPNHNLWVHECTES